MLLPTWRHQVYSFASAKTLGVKSVSSCICKYLHKNDDKTESEPKQEQKISERQIIASIKAFDYRDDVKKKARRI